MIAEESRNWVGGEIKKKSRNSKSRKGNVAIETVSDLEVDAIATDDNGDDSVMNFEGTSKEGERNNAGDSEEIEEDEFVRDETDDESEETNYAAGLDYEELTEVNSNE